MRLGEPWDQDGAPDPFFSRGPAPEAGRRNGGQGRAGVVAVPSPRTGLGKGVGMDWAVLAIPRLSEHRRGLYSVAPQGGWGRAVETRRSALCSVPGKSKRELAGGASRRGTFATRMCNPAFSYPWHRCHPWLARSGLGFRGRGLAVIQHKDLGGVAPPEAFLEVGGELKLVHQALTEGDPAGRLGVVRGEAELAEPAERLVLLGVRQKG